MNILLFIVARSIFNDFSSKLRMKNEWVFIAFISLQHKCFAFKGPDLYQSLLNNYDRDIPAVKVTVC